MYIHALECMYACMKLTRPELYQLRNSPYIPPLEQPQTRTVKGAIFSPLYPQTLKSTVQYNDSKILFALAGVRARSVGEHMTGGIRACATLCTALGMQSR